MRWYLGYPSFLHFHCLIETILVFNYCLLFSDIWQHVGSCYVMELEATKLSYSWFLGLKLQKHHPCLSDGPLFVIVYGLQDKEYINQEANHIKKMLLAFSSFSYDSTSLYLANNGFQYCNFFWNASYSIHKRVKKFWKGFWCSKILDT